MRVTFRVQRFDPDADQRPHVEQYVVELEPTDRVLDGLNEIKWYQDGSLAYRRSCGHGVCGSDAMRINGRNRLACKVLVRDLGERITVEPDKCGGRPCIRGLRIRVTDILGMLADGVSHDQILRDFPYLEPDDIKAALAYAARQADHAVLQRS